MRPPSLLRLRFNGRNDASRRTLKTKTKETKRNQGVTPSFVVLTRPCCQLALRPSPLLTWCTLPLLRFAAILHTGINNFFLLSFVQRTPPFNHIICAQRAYTPRFCYATRLRVHVRAHVCIAGTQKKKWHEHFNNQSTNRLHGTQANPQPSYPRRPGSRPPADQEFSWRVVRNFSEKQWSPQWENCRQELHFGQSDITREIRLFPVFSCFFSLKK